MRIGNRHLFVPGRRGNALVVSMLLLVTLTSVGLVAMQQTNTDLLVSSNVARQSQSAQAGEAGLWHGLIQVPPKLGDYVLQLGQMRTADVNQRMGSLVAEASTTSALPATKIPTLFSGNLQASNQQDAAYNVETVWIREVSGMPGSEVGSDVCFEMFDFTATGMTHSNQSAVQSRARAAVGPNRCLLSRGR